MAQLIGGNGLVLSVVPVARRFYEPTTVLEANYLRVVCTAGPQSQPQSTTLTLFNWELADLAKWLRRLSQDFSSPQFDPHSEMFSFWGRHEAGRLRVCARIYGESHELLATREDVARFADQLEGELREFPIVTVEDA